MAMRFLLFITLISFSTLSFAQIIKLNADLSALPAAVQAQAQAEIDQLEADLNEDIPAGSPARLMEGMANSSVMSGKGISSDYITNFDAFTVGLGVGVGADLEKQPDVDSDLSGVGVAGGLVLGINVNKIFDDEIFGLETKKMNLMAHFLTYEHESDFDDGDIKAELLSFGFRLNYKWIEGNGNKFLGWDGVRVHTGYEYNNTKLNFTTSVDENVNESVGGGATISGTIAGDPNSTIEVSTHSIPVEISTGFNFLYFLSLYGGLGTDINYGSAKGNADANSDNNTLTCAGGPCSGENFTVSVLANVNEEGSVSPLLFRGFAGLQFNLPYFRLYGQVDKALGNDLIGVSAGMRLAF